MSEPDEYKEPGVNGYSAAENAEEGFSGNASADSEYPYSGADFENAVYSDAHFEPAGSSTEPPRYYTPPEPKKTEPKERTGKGLKAVGVIALCLVCALLGGLVGASFMGRSLDERLDALEQAQTEQAISQISQAAAQSGTETKPAATEVKSESSALSATAIYEQACGQVVGVTTEVTYTNFFGMNSSSAVSGTGFIIREDGYILTNYHVIEYAAQDKSVNVDVILYDGTRYTASIVGYEKYNDVAVLKIDASGLNAVSFGNSDSIAVGEVVYAVGNPLGELDFSMSTGHVSALDRAITSDESGVAINMFQIDAAVNSGNSGGPVYNAAGEVVGIVTAKYASTGVEGLGFAIPINDAAKIADDLITKGYVTGKAQMGITFDPDYNSTYGQYYASYWRMPSGTYVKEVTPGSSAEKAGIQAKDIITRLGDTEIKNYSDLTAALYGFSAGETTEVTVYRAGEEIVLTITFDEARS